MSRSFNRLAYEMRLDHAKRNFKLLEDNHLFTDQQLDRLKQEFSKIKRVDPSSPTYKKMIALIETFTKEQLKQVAKANIPFLSMLAAHRVPKEKPDEKKMIGDLYHAFLHHYSQDLKHRIAEFVEKVLNDANIRDSEYFKSHGGKSSAEDVVENMIGETLLHGSPVTWVPR